MGSWVGELEMMILTFHWRGFLSFEEMLAHQDAGILDMPMKGNSHDNEKLIIYFVICCPQLDFCPI